MKNRLFATTFSFNSPQRKLVTYYAYCFNNPINMDDHCGNWPQFVHDAYNWIKGAIKWGTENIAKPVVNFAKDSLSKVDATYSIGAGVSGGCGLAGTAQIGISIDTKGNVALQANVSAGTSCGLGVSANGYISTSNAPNIDKLTGVGSQNGGSLSIPPIVAGLDYNHIPDRETGNIYEGATFTIGPGVKGEIHSFWGNTFTIPQTSFNVYSIIDDFFIMIEEW